MDKDTQDRVRNVIAGWRNYLLNDIESIRVAFRAAPENKDCTDDEIDALVVEQIEIRKQLTWENAGDPFVAQLADGLLEQIQKEAAGKSCEDALLELQKNHVILILTNILNNKPIAEDASKLFRGTKGRQAIRDRRVDALLGEYDSASEVGMSPEDAMLKANSLLEDYGFKPYATNPPRQLRAILKEHRPSDWP